MPRPKVDSCMFCEPDAPCEAHVKATKAKRVKTAKPSPKLQDMSDLSGSTQNGNPPPVAPPVANIKSAMKAASHSEADRDFVDALIVLEPILHPTERARWASTMNTVASPAERWKARNRG